MYWDINLTLLITFCVSEGDKPPSGFGTTRCVAGGVGGAIRGHTRCPAQPLSNAP